MLRLLLLAGLVVSPFVLASGEPRPLEEVRVIDLLVRTPRGCDGIASVGPGPLGPDVKSFHIEVDVTDDCEVIIVESRLERYDRGEGLGL